MNFKFPQANFYFAIAIAVLLPFKFLISPIIACWLIYQLANYKNLELQNLFKKKWVVLSLLFFAAHAIAYFFSDNSKEALFSIEVKLSFLLLPLLFANSKFENPSKNKLLIAFVCANTLALVLCLINSFVHYLKHSTFLTYNEFCLFMHPSYFSMYLAFSLFFLLVRFIEIRSIIKSKLVYFSVLIFLVTGIFLAASKMGILTFFALSPLIILFQLYKRKYFKTILLVILFFLASGLFFMYSDSLPAARMKNVLSVFSSQQLKDKTTSESNAVRVLIWEESIQLVKDQPLLGYTPGDTNDQLYTSYEKNGLSGALNKKLNAHNQFLQTAIGLGLLGLFLLGAMLIQSIWFGIKTKNELQLFFGLLIIMNFFVESMLQTSAGTLFFVFFYSLLQQTAINNSRESNFQIT
jgi:O-antigen ligase